MRESFMTKAYNLPVGDAFSLFREHANAGNYHDYDFKEIIRSIIDALSEKPNGLDNVKIPFISTSHFLKTESGEAVEYLFNESDLDGINTAIYHLTFALLNCFVVLKLYDENDKLTTTHFILDTNKDTLVVYPHSLDLYQPDES